MNVNEIYNLIKNAVCLQCRKDIETACHDALVYIGNGYKPV